MLICVTDMLIKAQLPQCNWSTAARNSRMCRAYAAFETNCDLIGPIKVKDITVSGLKNSPGLFYSFLSNDEDEVIRFLGVKYIQTKCAVQADF